MGDNGLFGASQWQAKGLVLAKASKRMESKAVACTQIVPSPLTDDVRLLILKAVPMVGLAEAQPINSRAMAARGCNMATRLLGAYSERTHARVGGTV